MSKGPHFAAIELHWPYDVAAEEIRARCVEHGLLLLGVNTPAGNVAAGEFGLAALPWREDEFRAGFDRTAAYARVAGATSIHVMAGVINPNQREAAEDALLANLDYACRAAPDFMLLLEPMNPVDRPCYFYSTAEQVAGIIARVGAPNLEIMFDCYHIAMAGGDVIGDLSGHLDDIGHVQIAAVPDRGEPGQGSLDYVDVFEALNGLGYSGWIGCEYRPRGDADVGLGWLASLI